MVNLFRKRMKYLVQFSNFSIDIKSPDEKNWGVPNENGTWNGALGQILVCDLNILVISFVYSF